MATYQIGVNIIADIKPGEKADVLKLLDSMNSDPANNPIIPFAKFSNLHFGRIFVMDEMQGPGGTTVEASLALMCEIDAPLEKHLQELVKLAGPGLDLLFGHCVEYPPLQNLGVEERLRYIKAHLVKPSAYYINTVGRTVDTIIQEAKLREAIEDFLDHPTQSWAGMSAIELRQKIQEYVNTTAELSFARKPAGDPGLIFKLQEIWNLLWVPLLGLILLPLLIFIIPIWLLLLRFHEMRDEVDTDRPSEAQIQKLAVLEDYVAQNQFGAVGFIKPGWFRFITVKVILFLAEYSLRHFFNKENLAGVKTIHFARWVPLNNMHRLVFASNYNGSLESYMDDFIDKVSWGLNAVFSNGMGYPKTSWLVFGGAVNEQAFKNYLRVHQIPTQVWYTAYSHLTCINIANNGRIREGLYGEMNEEQASEWLLQL